MFKIFHAFDLKKKIFSDVYVNMFSELVFTFLCCGCMYDECVYEET